MCTACAPQVQQYLRELKPELKLDDMGPSLAASRGAGKAWLATHEAGLARGEEGGGELGAPADDDGITSVALSVSSAAMIAPAARHRFRGGALPSSVESNIDEEAGTLL